MSVWPAILECLDTHGAAALVTLARVRGSSPRDPGARMVVRPDGGFSGTIGGGALEWAALAEAQALLGRGEPSRSLDRALGPELGQCCGGAVTLEIERFVAADRPAVVVFARAEAAGPIVTVAARGSDGRWQRRLADAAEATDLGAAAGLHRCDDGRLLERFGREATALYLFGAGHVGRALALALAPLPFAVTWADPRPGMFPDPAPADTTCLAAVDLVDLLVRAPDGAFVVVMTHSHALDLDLVTAAVAAGRFPYVGLIGSTTKRVRFVVAMRKMGIAADVIDRLSCPIGLAGIHDKTPAVIAAATAAELLIAREAALAARTSGEASSLGRIGDAHG